jgi:hypothetical protein
MEFVVQIRKKRSKTFFIQKKKIKMDGLNKIRNKQKETHKKKMRKLNENNINKHK